MNNGKPADATSNPDIKCVSFDPNGHNESTCFITLFSKFLKLTFMQIILKNM